MVLFDGVSAALMQHTTQRGTRSSWPVGQADCVWKFAHPVNTHAGVNALTAARIGLAAVDRMRDAMPGIYFHYTITECHDAEVEISDFSGMLFFIEQPEQADCAGQRSGGVRPQPCESGRGAVH